MLNFPMTAARLTCVSILRNVQHKQCLCFIVPSLSTPQIPYTASAVEARSPVKQDRRRSESTACLFFWLVPCALQGSDGQENVCGLV